MAWIGDFEFGIQTLKACYLRPDLKNDLLASIWILNKLGFVIQMFPYLGVHYLDPHRQVFGPNQPR